jgi:hypothetical protein
MTGNEGRERRCRVMTQLFNFAYSIQQASKQGREYPVNKITISRNEIPRIHEFTHTTLQQDTNDKIEKRKRPKASTIVQRCSSTQKSAGRPGQWL